MLCRPHPNIYNSAHADRAGYKITGKTRPKYHSKNKATVKVLNIFFLPKN